MWYVAAFIGGILTAFGSIIGIGSYAFRHPEMMAPIARKMTRAMMSGGNKK